VVLSKVRIGQKQAFILMHHLEDILSRSVSKNELVVSYSDAMELLRIYLEQEQPVVGWEGWIKAQDGSLGHSQRHQGTTDLSSMSTIAAIALLKSSIMQSHSEWEERPEVENAELYFCITMHKYAKF